MHLWHNNRRSDPRDKPPANPLQIDKDQLPSPPEQDVGDLQEVSGGL